MPNGDKGSADFSFIPHPPAVANITWNKKKIIITPYRTIPVRRLLKDEDEDE